jgi:hypothetical protein
MIPLSILIGTTIAWLVVLLATCSEGYQSDERGFVLGPEPVDDAGAQSTDALSFALSVPFHTDGVRQ